MAILEYDRDKLIAELEKKRKEAEKTLVAGRKAETIKVLAKGKVQIANLTKGMADIRAGQPGCYSRSSYDFGEYDPAPEFNGREYDRAITRLRLTSQRVVKLSDKDFDSILRLL